MKRLCVSFCIIVLLCMCALSSCKQKKPVQANGKLNVVATIFPPYDFTREIAGDKVNLTMLLPPAIETHSFQPTPRDI
ncbi:MAG: zinc ABC transporter substrate-binding protein, partial [Spirochaetaceae bacterium]|nr:zinc ABC transporter substrate-binding protein [Spirochaetaceae bacterium]